MEVQQKWELQQQESKRQRSGEESRFEEALNQPKIVNSSIEEVKQALKFAMIKVGLRAANFPTDEEKAILINHVYDNFGNHTPAEIRLAFDMALAGKLDLEADEIKCYENFSCLYFSQIMVAYRIWAGQTRAQIDREDNAHRLLTESTPKQMTEGDYLELFEAVKGDVLADKIEVPLIPEMLYEWLEKKGEIKLTTEKKKEYFNKAVEGKIAFYQARCTEQPSNTFFRTALDIYKNEHKTKDYSKASHISIVMSAKKLAVYDYIKSLDGKAG